MAAALALFAMAVVDFINPGDGETIDLRQEASAERRPGGAIGPGPIELHHLLPDASADLGRAVQVAGTIVGQVSDAGFWVRDLRDNLIYIGAENAASTARPRTGGTVRVRGVIAVLSPAEAEVLLRASALAPPAGSTIVREIRVRALAGGIDLLQED